MAPELALILVLITPGAGHAGEPALEEELCVQVRGFVTVGRTLPGLEETHVLACAAFPRAISLRIALDEVANGEPYPGDHGIRWAPTSEVTSSPKRGQLGWESLG